MNQRIARMTERDLLANAAEIIEAASAKLSALCHGERWRMSVPVQDDDSDVPIGALVQLARAQDQELADARRLLGQFVDDLGCSLDHHGYCQTHGWLAPGGCHVARARAFLDRSVEISVRAHGGSE